MDAALSISMNTMGQMALVQARTDASARPQVNSFYSLAFLQVLEGHFLLVEFDL